MEAVDPPPAGKLVEWSPMGGVVSDGHSHRCRQGVTTQGVGTLPHSRKAQVTPASTTRHTSVQMTIRDIAWTLDHEDDADGIESGCLGLRA